MAEKKEKPERYEEKKEYSSLIRILQTDIPGNKKLIAGLSYIKGVSWSIANATCKLLKLDPNIKLKDLTKEHIDKITNFLNSPDSLPRFLMNRRKDFESGRDSHLITSALDMTKEFDIRRLKKIRSYRGLRHATGQPTRGQRTKSHFRSRKKNKSIGVKSKPKA
jgi:small subunit ribosomal protein S13